MHTLETCQQLGGWSDAGHFIADINLHDLVAIAWTGVFDEEINRIAPWSLLQFKNMHIAAVFKLGITQAVAEGEQRLC